jgi:hypothetical protein
MTENIFGQEIKRQKIYESNSRETHQNPSNEEGHCATIIPYLDMIKDDPKRGH